MKNIDKYLNKFNDSQLTELVFLGLKIYPLNDDIYSHNIVEEALSALYNTSDTQLTKAYSYNVTNTELFALWVLYGYNYSMVQKALFYPINSNPFINELHRLIDSLLSKAPSYSGRLLYRYDKYYPIEHIKRLYKSNQPLITPHYLTTDYEEYERDSDITFIIHPLDKDKTHAKEVYRILCYNENVPYPEHQINFERNTCFKIVSIDTMCNKCIVLLQELNDGDI